MNNIDKAAFLAHSMSNSFKKKISQTNNILANFINETSNPSISISFGKDSIVMLHLALKLKPDILCVHCDRGEGGDTEELKKLKSKLCSEWVLNLKTIKTDISVLDAFMEQKRIREYISKAMDDFNRNNNVDGVGLGFTYDESRGRRISILNYGLLFKMKSGLIRCYPLGLWTAKDVWAYIVKNNIPYYNFYDRLNQVGVKYTSQMSRTSSMVGVSGGSQGRNENSILVSKEIRDFFYDLPDDVLTYIG